MILAGRLIKTLQREGNSNGRLEPGIYMSKTKNADPLVAEIERALTPGKYIGYSETCKFVQDLEKVQKQLESLAPEATGRAVRLAQPNAPSEFTLRARFTDLLLPDDRSMTFWRNADCETRRVVF